LTVNNKYTCHEYREEMQLLGLHKRLHDKDISEEERQELKQKIKDLEASMGMQ
jgi:uncharacterized membrane protein YgcG